MKHSLTIPSLVLLIILASLASCRKEVPAGTTVSASGIVFDSVKNKVLANAKLYLFGANRTFYGIYYSKGPLYSVISDNNGKFSISFTADGTSIDYGLQLGVLEYGGYVYNSQTNYVIDNTQPLFKFNYSTNVTNAVVRGRELNYIKLHLKVLTNPFDTIKVRTTAIRQVTLVKGQSIDTTILLRQLPNEQNMIEYYTESIRDTVGYIPGQSIRRITRDTLQTGFADTLFHSKIIANSSLIPRQ